MGGGAGMVELDSVLKSSVLALGNKYDRRTSESKPCSIQILDGED